MKKRIDPYSGETFYPKRTNQRFATRDNQIAFNNAKAKKERDLHTKYDNQIKRNWNILKTILGNKQSKKHKLDAVLCFARISKKTVSSLF